MNRIYPFDRGWRPAEPEGPYGLDANNYLPEEEVFPLDPDAGPYDWQREEPYEDDGSVFSLEDWLAAFDEETDAATAQGPASEKWRRIRKRALWSLTLATFVYGVSLLAGEAERNDLEDRQESYERYYGGGSFDSKLFELDMIDSIAEREGVDSGKVRLVSRPPGRNRIEDGN